MPQYFPIKTGLDVDRRVGPFCDVKWELDHTWLTYELPQKSELIRVWFNDQTIIRILEDMAISTDPEKSPNSGLEYEWFAYRVEGATFLETQSDAWKAVFGPVNHYRFFTPDVGVDVVCSEPPIFSLIKPA